MNTVRIFRFYVNYDDNLIRRENKYLNLVRRLKLISITLSSRYPDTIHSPLSGQKKVLVIRTKVCFVRLTEVFLLQVRKRLEKIGRQKNITVHLGVIPKIRRIHSSKARKLFHFSLQFLLSGLSPDLFLSG